MATTWFYAPSIADNWLLPIEEARHCLTVLRHRVGDTLTVVDGKGYQYQVQLSTSDPKRCLVTPIAEPIYTPPRPLAIHLAVSPTKNNSRIEWLLEKVTEIGVEEIHFVATAHAERQTIKIDRLMRVVVSAMKQSKKSRLPVLHPLQPASAWLSQCMQPHKFIAHLTSEAVPLGHVSPTEGAVVVWIGPEGDFSTTELAAAADNGFQVVTVSPYRLRTETAAMVAVEQCNFVAQMKQNL